MMYARVPQALIMQGAKDLTIFGRHAKKMQLVSGATRVIASSTTEQLYGKAFDVCVDATGDGEPQTLVSSPAMQPQTSRTTKQPCVRLHP